MKAAVDLSRRPEIDVELCRTVGVLGLCRRIETAVRLRGSMELVVGLCRRFVTRVGPFC